MGATRLGSIEIEALFGVRQERTRRRSRAPSAHRTGRSRQRGCGRISQIPLLRKPRARLGPGSRPFGETTFNYVLSYATQSEAGANPNTVDEDYGLLEAGLARGKFSAALGYELLSGNGTTSFSTPLATLHAFQGWADKFLATPANGIADSYLKFGYRPGMTGPFDNVSLAAVYHEFEADLGGAAYGDEIDFSVSARKDRVTLMLKYAAYAADTLLTDTDKLWFQMEYVF